jgi:DMSO/TMAO reductase YedYZ molybdopterin-dependent catalytic subunit
MRSPFRPAAPRDPAIPDEHRPLLRSLERRGLIKRGLTLGALAMLTGCDVNSSSSVEAALLAISRFNDRVQALIFNPAKLAPTYPASLVLQPPKFNAYYDITQLKPVNPATWRLELAGRIADKRPWTVQQIDALPATDMVVKLFCVEGWDYIGSWSGPTLRSFLTRVGADLSARYVAFHTADNYPSSIDMASALHPQTLLATKYAGSTLADPFGFPLRLRIPTKLGFKNPKWITAIEVTNDYKPGFWEKGGFNWFSGV